ncbi:RNA polymerase II subunit A C-terminal domain phosphatase-like isoform X2 [Ctenocephalides felis]|uniref:RNA polymerase II subunit A C-terminal domain phosphatase-like isoform X2 n=1 Tax=Ctenocephalides felis TaxID=7515 RepID=UPI000E6E2F0E|nr:RNA polymerase II subunit A C-terminal domain phosphatase-like isoform X2 [Ctenocephalides felis]
MADNTVMVTAGVEKSIKILKWKVKEGFTISIGQIILLYDFVNIAKSEQKRLKAIKAGKIKRLVVREGDIVDPGSAILEIEECTHPTVMRDMCGECGADLRKSANNTMQSTGASVAMVHSVPDLKVSHELAQKLGKADSERLLQDRKLVLLVDLDQTLIHTTNDNVPVNIKDVYHFQLYGQHSPWYHTRLRPGTQKFLKNMSAFFELHICTFGARNYAHTIAMFLDRDGKYFSHRILSRDECFNSTTKTANLKALFPCGDNMVCIMDDREDVWSYAPNLIHVKPYHFFRHTGDINAPPGLGKTEQDDVLPGPDLTGLSKMVRNLERKLKSTKSNVGELEESSSLNVKDNELLGSVEKSNACTKNTALSENTENSENSETTEVNSENIRNSETAENAEVAETVETAENIKTIEDAKTEENVETAENMKTIEDAKTEENVEIAEKIITKEDDKTERNVQTVENAKNAEASMNDITEIAELEDNSKATESNKEESSTENGISEKNCENKCLSDDKEEDDGLIELEDADDYLLYLEVILKNIHQEFYRLYDKENATLPDLKVVIPAVKKKVLDGLHLVFSGLVPTHVKLEHSKAYMVAKSLGATVTQDLTNTTSHLVAVRSGTAKVNKARRKHGIKIVTPDWLWSCAERWEHVEECLFPLTPKPSRNRHPPPHCSSPEHNSEIMQIEQANEAGNTVGRKRTASGRFMDTINPLLSFSTDDIADMDREVEDIFNESDSDGEANQDEDDDELYHKKEEQRIKKQMQKMANESIEISDSSSSDVDTLSGSEHPHGWNPENSLDSNIKSLKRKRSTEGISDIISPMQDEENQFCTNTKRRWVELHNGDDSSGDEASEGSRGSNDPPDEIDDGEWNMMGAALEREFLGLD